MNAELLLPAEASILREALAAWAERNRPAVPAAERVRRIRAQLNAAAGKPLFATAREPRDTKVSRLSWLAAACAAALVAAACAGWLYHTLGQPAVPVAQPGEEKSPAPAGHEKKETSESENAPVVAAPIVATAGNATPGLFRQVTANPHVWQAVKGAAQVRAGELLQVATNGQAAELTVGKSHRLKMWPGTVVRIDLDERSPRVELWHGQLDAWAKDGSLLVTGQPQQFSKPNLNQVLADGLHLSAHRSTERVRARIFEQDGFLLVDTEALPGGMYAASVNVPGPENVRVQEGTANLLNVIDADLANVPVKDAVETFVALINVRIKLSPAAEQAAGAKQVTLKIEKLTGAEALAKFCNLAGLTFHIEQGEIVLRLPNEPKAAPAPENPEF